MLEREIRGMIVRAAVEGVPAFEPPEDAAELQLSLDEPLPLVAQLHHEVVDTTHVWVAVQEAALAVVTEEENRVVEALAGGASPGSVARSEGWDMTSAVVARIAAAGLVRGLTGYRERTPLKVGRFSRLHLTKSCQLECAHCYADSSPHVDRTGELPTSRWLAFVDDFAAQGGERVLFTGGEALLHDGCLEIMAAARAAGLHVTLFSNGILVPKRAAEIHAVADQVQISLDGPDAESNDAIRGRNAFKHITRALDALARLGTPTRIGMTAVPLRWQTWVEHFHLIRDRYADYPNISFKLNYGVMAYGRGTALEKTEVATKREVDGFLAEVNGDMSPQITRHSPGCGYAEQVVVGPDGTVYPCHLLDAPVCNIDDAPLPEIVDLLAGLARQADVDHVEGCRDCEIRYLCGGTCRVLASHATGSRLVTTCTPKEKADKYRNLVSSFGGSRTNRR